MNAAHGFRARRRAPALLLVGCLAALAVAPASAQRRAGNKKDVQTRQTTRTDMSGGGNRRENGTSRRDVNRNTNVNVNRNTNVNVNINVNHRGGYYGGCCYDNGPSVAGVIATAIVVGAIVASLPPSCTTIIANGMAFQNCGGTYYQSQYVGGSVQYVVVNHP